MSDPAAPSSALTAALKRVLKPLVRLLIARGVTLPQLIELLKQTYVSVAEDEFPINGKRQTDSRISLLTGVHRKDIKRLRETPETDIAPPPKAVSLGAALINAWASRDDTTDTNGRPLPLPRHEGKGVTFESLAEDVSKDVRPRAVLDELIRVGAARIDDDDQVVLNQAALVPDTGFDEKAFYFGRNVGDHIAATTYNLTASSDSGGNPMMERSVHYGGLTAKSIAELEAAAEQLGMDALLTLNRLALDRVEQDTGAPEANQRMSFGLYFFDSARTLGPNTSPETSEDGKK